MKQTKMCPNCGLEGTFNEQWVRRNFKVSNPLQVDVKDVLTIRFPVYRCSLCSETFAAPKTQQTIVGAINEHMDRVVLRKAEEAEEKAHKLRKQAVDAHRFAGFILGSLWVSASWLWIEFFDSGKGFWIAYFMTLAGALFWMGIQNIDYKYLKKRKIEVQTVSMNKFVASIEMVPHPDDER